MRYWLLGCLTLLSTLCYSWDTDRFHKLVEQPVSEHFQEFNHAFERELMLIAKGANPDDLNIEVLPFLKSVMESKFQQTKEEDAKVRPVYVAAQGDFEKTMAYFMGTGKIQHLVGIIHTPTPATPLCSQVQEKISAGLIHKSIQDPQRIFTVLKRPEIVRMFLEHKGTLIAAYPQAGKNKRTQEQLLVYQTLCDTYPHHLIDLPLYCDALRADLIGATYLFCTTNGDWFSFGIRASQARSPDDNRRWELWFGPLANVIISKKVYEVIDYLDHVQNRDILDLILKSNTNC